jgi:glycerophosphoryl diester phosphodiesterase
MSKPMIIAHRGGGQNWPENTIFAFKRDATAGVDAIELDVQLTADNQLAVYQPRDLSERTEGNGPISSKTLKEVQSLVPGLCSGEPGISQEVDPELRIPSLKEVLREIPNIPIIVDLKSMPAEPLVQALATQIPPREFSRLIFYSTESEHIEWLRKEIPSAVIFEDRDITFQRLIESQSPYQWSLASNSSVFEISEKTSLSTRTYSLDLGSSGLCTHPSAASWIGFELKRKLKVEEPVCTKETVPEKEFELWNEESVNCARLMTHGAHIVFFGINTPEDYETALRLGADAVYTDNPVALLNLK